MATTGPVPKPWGGKMPKEAIIALLSRKTIAYQVEFAILFDVPTAVFLSQALYWHGKSKYKDYFYKTAEEWEEETGLTRRQQERCRKVLVDAGVLKVHRKGIPPVLHFALQLDPLGKLLETLNPNSTERRIGIPPNRERIPESTQRLLHVEEPRSSVKESVNDADIGETSPTVEVKNVPKTLNGAAHKAMFAALAAVFGGPSNASERGRLNKAVKLLRQSGATPETVPKLVERAQALGWGPQHITPLSLASNYSVLHAKPPTIGVANDDGSFYI